MKPHDKNYLSQQFQIKIYSKTGTEFQSFFEDILDKAYSDFQRIRPYGKEGDAGNDGYRKDSGIYYQVYAPRTPQVNEAAAAGKLEEDFHKLKDGWDEISKIKVYNFVFNDKYDGSIQLLEKTITELEAKNPGIDFRLFLAKDLEKVFFQLTETDILGLGFDIDQRQAIANAYAYLDIVKTELDRENTNSAQRVLVPVKNIISELDDQNLLLEYEILECRCFQKSEKIDEAKKMYENISKRYPRDPRPLLFLAEIYLNDKDFDKNSELLKKAEKIDANYWLLKLEQLVTKLNIGEKIALEDINEDEFPKDPKEKASFYRLYALVFQDRGDQTNADSFIENAINLTPERFINYLDQLTLTEMRIFNIEDVLQRVTLSKELLSRTKEVENRFLEYGDIGARNKANLNIRKLSALEIQQNISEVMVLAKETFDLTIACYFDKRIEHLITLVLRAGPLSDTDLTKLLDYLRQTKVKISDDLSKALITQFNIRNSLFTQGRNFFKDVNNPRYVEFISDLENNEYDKVLEFLGDDILFSLTFFSTLNGFSDLRKKIIENLPDDKNIQKEKLRLLLNYDEKEFGEAFQILKQLDLSQLSYVECWPMLQIAQENQAWDYAIVILEKLLEKASNDKDVLNLNLQLFTANFNLNRFQEVINLGEKILSKDVHKKLLDRGNKEALLTNTIIACLERGKVDDDAFKKAKSILEKYSLEKPSFEYKAGIEAEVYLANNEVDTALKSIIEGVKIKKTPSAHEYVKLYFVLFLRIGNHIDINLDSLEKVTDNTFVKLTNKDRWYFIGNDNELDAFKIPKTHNKYSSFFGKSVGDLVDLGSKYSSQTDEEIELIFPVEQYILWQSRQTFQNLGREGLLEGVDMIEVPEIGDTIDTKNLLRFMDDLHKRTEEFFEIYCSNNIPLAVLAVSEGGLIGAVGRLQQEGKGFIHCSSGTFPEFQKQKDIAKKVLEDRLPFYIDGTSALFLAEIGILPKIHSHIPNLKASQSVLNLLATVTDRFRYVPGQQGYMGYSQGKLTFSSVEKEKRDLIWTLANLQRIAG